MGGVPLQQDADFNDPRKALAWALVALPFKGASVPLLVGPDALGDWSEALVKRGVFFDPDRQEEKFQPAGDNANWITGAAGEWVPVDKPLPPESTAPSIAHLTLDEKRVLFERLQAEFEQPVSDLNQAVVVQ